MGAPSHLSVVRVPAQDSARDPAPAATDVALLAFLLVLHTVPLVAWAAGGSWGSGVVGYATAAVLLSGRELVHELRACWRAGWSWVP